jgi:hypothetical protein
MMQLRALHRVGKNFVGVKLNCVLLSRYNFRWKCGDGVTFGQVLGNDRL